MSTYGYNKLKNVYFGRDTIQRIMYGTNKVYERSSSQSVETIRTEVTFAEYAERLNNGEHFTRAELPNNVTLTANHVTVNTSDYRVTQQQVLGVGKNPHIQFTSTDNNPLTLIKINVAACDITEYPNLTNVRPTVDSGKLTYDEKTQQLIWEGNATSVKFTPVSTFNIKTVEYTKQMIPLTISTYTHAKTFISKHAKKYNIRFTHGEYGNLIYNNTTLQPTQPIEQYTISIDDITTMKFNAPIFQYPNDTDTQTTRYILDYNFNGQYFVQWVVHDIHSGNQSLTFNSQKKIKQIDFIYDYSKYTWTTAQKRALKSDNGGRFLFNDDRWIWRPASTSGQNNVTLRYAMASGNNEEPRGALFSTIKITYSNEQNTNISTT